MTLDDIRFTSVLPSPKWQREAALRLMKLLCFYSLLSLGGALLLLLAKGAIAWATAAIGVIFMFGLIGGGTGVFLLYRWLILAGTPEPPVNKKPLASPGELEPPSASELTDPFLAKTPASSAGGRPLDGQKNLKPPPTSGLTEPQRELLKFIEEYTRERGIAPAHREICQKLGFSSYGTAYKHLKLLQQKGFLRRDWNQKRGIELIRSIPGGEGSSRDLPYFGQIAAGRPIEALSGNDRVTVPGHLLCESGGDHYVLRVVGESMIGEGIYDGDFVIVLRRDWAETGDIAVVLVGNEATLKLFYPEGDLVYLQPANPTMQTIQLPARDARVQGVVVGLIRKY